jgi:quercetin dioxygenase-like cupin family protein
MDDDPDDYRPSSSWLLQVDPEGRVPVGLIRERIGPGDRIPRHWHDVDEIVLYESGIAVVHLDGVDYEVAAGDTLFIPAGAVHGTRNIGSEAVEVRAVYPQTKVRIDMVERNPMPGTENRPPQVSSYDLATGEFRILGETDLSRLDQP